MNLAQKLYQILTLAIIAKPSRLDKIDIDPRLQYEYVTIVKVKANRTEMGVQGSCHYYYNGDQFNSPEENPKIDACLNAVKSKEERQNWEKTQICIYSPEGSVPVLRCLECNAIYCAFHHANHTHQYYPRPPSQPKTKYKCSLSYCNLPATSSITGRCNGHGNMLHFKVGM